ncbi:hypothetical protein BD410DRAFT_784227 [Rickenella mellea]|uniref:Uncharacterized protein n=1 Tax=Rickenella mellea TaxID=50990 RepID=A0A4Y7QER9_9AGAM|nr:hypothetical protein BD410DRAFT_784227 [Rickenella mellea]
MAHRRTASSAAALLHSLQLPSLPQPSSSSRTTAKMKRSFISSIVDAAPQNNKLRASAFALFTLLALAAYGLLGGSIPIARIDFISASPPPHPRPLSAAQRASAAALAAAGPHHPPHQEIVLTRAQELGALTSFLAALPANSLPAYIDPSQPIDPQLILDFDTRSPHALDELEDVITQVWQRNPVVVFSKFYSPASREIKKIIGEMNLRPEPTIFEVDQRVDTEVLSPLLLRLTRAHELPVLVIGGEPIRAGDMPALRAVAKSGKLRTLAKAAGAIVDGGKGKGRKEHKFNKHKA